MHKTEFLKLLRECRELSKGAAPEQQYKMLSMLSKAHKMVVEQQRNQKAAVLESATPDLGADYLQEK